MNENDEIPEDFVSSIPRIVYHKCSIEGLIYLLKSGISRTPREEEFLSVSDEDLENDMYDLNDLHFSLVFTIPDSIFPIRIFYLKEDFDLDKDFFGDPDYVEEEKRMVDTLLEQYRIEYPNIQIPKRWVEKSILPPDGACEQEIRLTR